MSWLTKQPIAHRGLHNGKDAIENSPTAFKLAIKNNYAIEMDLQCTKDNEIVVFHDSSLKRVCGNKAKLKKLTLAQLKEIKLPNGEDILTLNEFFDLINNQVPVLIEIKTHLIYKKFVDKILEIVSNYDGEYCLQSFSPQIMNYISKRFNKKPIGILCANLKETALPPISRYMLENFKFLRFKPDFIAYNINAFPKKVVDNYRKEGTDIITWTISSDELLKKAELYAHNIIFEQPVDPINFNSKLK